MHLILALYRLAKGCSFDKYCKWSVEFDQPMTSKQPQIKQFKVYKVKDNNSEKVGFDIVEIAEITNVEEWSKNCKEGDMKGVLDQWKNYGDAESLTMVGLEEVR